MTDSRSLPPPPVPERPRRPDEHVAAWPDVPRDQGQAPSGPGPDRSSRPRMPEWVMFAAVVVVGAIISIWALIYITSDRSIEVAADAPETPVPGTTIPSTTAPPTTGGAAPDDPADESAEPESAESDESESDESAGEQAPPEEGDAELAQCPAETPTEICDAAAFVERAAGRPFQQFPTVELLEDAEFEQRLLGDFDAEADDLADLTAVFRSLGLLGPDQDLDAIYRELLSVGVVGFYDPQTGALVVRGTEFNLFAQSVLVHELVHAHDDQWHDLDRPELDDTSDESAYGFSAVVEGNARRIESDWVAQLTADEQSRLSAQELALFDAGDIARLQSLPLFLLELQISPYEDGEAFVSAVVASSGLGGIDELYAAPPRSSEVVLEPDRYFDGEQPLAVPVPDANGAEVMSGAFGELMFEILFGRRIDGWGGDQFVTVESGAGACTTIDAVGDTDGATDELYSAALDWAADGVSRSVQETTVADRPGIRIVSCS